MKNSMPKGIKATLLNYLAVARGRLKGFKNRDATAFFFGENT